MGPNGAGKTTTLSILAGRQTATSGAALIAGVPAGSAEARRHLGYCPQARFSLQLYVVLGSTQLSGAAILSLAMRVAGFVTMVRAGNVHMNVSTLPVTSQVDPLLDLMTGQEHLAMYARLKVSSCHHMRLLLNMPWFSLYVSTAYPSTTHLSMCLRCSRNARLALQMCVLPVRTANHSLLASAMSALVLMT